MKIVPERSSLARWLAVGLGTVAGLGVLFTRLYPKLILQLAHCPLRDMTGLACPTCGGTHALVALTRGHLIDAFVENPGVVIAGLVFGLWVMWGLAAMAWTRLRIAVVLAPREKRVLRTGVVVLFLGTWLWEICRLTL